MKARSSGRISLLIIVGLTAVGFVAWLVLLMFLWFGLRMIGFETDFWAMTEALSTAVGAATVISAGLVAYWELSEVADSRHMEVADRLFAELNSNESIEARRWILQKLPDDPEQGLSSLTPKGQEYVKHTLNSLDRVAFLTQADWIPDKMIMPWMNPMIVKAWRKLGPYVDYESNRRNEPDYYEHARQLAKRCLAWREKNLPGKEIEWVDNAL